MRKGGGPSLKSFPSYTKNIFMFKCFAARLINHLAKWGEEEGGQERDATANWELKLKPESESVAESEHPGQSCSACRVCQA